MNSAGLHPQDGVNLWQAAIANLTDEQRESVDFAKSNKLDVLSDLLDHAERARQSSVDKAWRFTRANGEVVIIRDVLAKVVKCVHRFKEIGDVIVQYDPAHAALPWAGVRFILEVAVSDFNSFAFILEKTPVVASLINRHAIIEGLLLQAPPSPAKGDMRNSMIRLYTTVLSFLAGARAYFLKSTARRILKSVSSRSDLESCFQEVVAAESQVSQSFSAATFQEQLNRLSDLKQLLLDGQASISRWDGELGRLIDHLDQSKRTEILKWLSMEPYSKHHRQIRRGVLEGTGQWLLSDPQYIKWKDDSASSMLWLHGIPGSGKSKLISIVIEDAISSFENKQSPYPAYFYCSRNPGELGRSNPDKVLASIARQLSSTRHSRTLLHPTIALYECYEEGSFSQESLGLDESCDLILQLAALYPMVTIIIDALDECNPETRKDLVQALQDIILKSPTLVKILVSSRDDQDIVYRLTKYPNLEISSARNGNDIVRYVESQTASLVKAGDLLRYSTRKDEIRSKIVCELSNKADGMFLWPSLQIQALCQLHSDAAILERIEQAPPKLFDLYRELLGKIELYLAQADRLYAKNTLMWLLCARDSLPADDFLRAISRTASPEFDVTRDHILGLCNKLVVFDDGLDTFRFAHLSVREFFEAEPSFAASLSNAFAAETCLSLLTGLDEHVTATKPPLSTLHDNTESITWHTYADLYWGYHCRNAGESRREARLHKLLLAFLPDVATDRSPYSLWKTRIDVLSGNDVVLDSELDDCYMSDPSVLLTACVFDLFEVVARHKNVLDRVSEDNVGEAENCLCAAASYGCCQAIEVLLSIESLTITEEFILAASCSEQAREVLTVVLNSRGDSVEAMDAFFCAAAELSENGEELLELAFQVLGDKAKVTAEHLHTAAANEENGRGIVALLLQRAGNLKITTPVLESAASNEKCGKEVLTLLLHERGHEFKITQGVARNAVENEESGRDILTLLFRERGDQFVVTEEVLVSAASNEQSGKAILALLVEERKDEVRITEMILCAAASNKDSGKDVLNFLFEAFEAEFTVTEAVLKSAIEIAVLEVISLLLEKAGSTSVVTPGVLQDAATNNNDGVMALLLARPEAANNITKEVIRRAAKYSNAHVVAILLEKGQDCNEIVEEIFLASAQNEHAGVEVMKLLRSQYQQGTTVTEKVLMIAAKNSGTGRDILNWLLEEPGMDDSITEKVFLAAAGNLENGKEVMQRLLRTPASRQLVTENVLVAAAANETIGGEVMEVLLREVGDSISITEGVLVAAAMNESQGRKVLQLLISERGSEVQVTERILVAAAKCTFEDKPVLELLLTERRDEIKITETVLTTAASNIWAAKDIMSLLLRRMGSEIHFTEKVLAAAAANVMSGKKLIEMLLRTRRETMEFTEMVLTAAALNESDAKGIFDLLFKELGDTVSIKETVLVMATANERFGLELITSFCKNSAHVRFTHAAIEAAAASGQTSMLEYISRSDSSLHVSQDHYALAAFYGAARDGDLDRVQSLFDWVPDTDKKNPRGFTPLWRAAESGQVEIVAFLTSKRTVDVNSRDASGRTVLFPLAARGRMNMIRVLLDAGADPTLEDNAGNTAISTARKHGFSKIVSLLCSGTTR